MVLILRCGNQLTQISRHKVTMKYKVFTKHSRSVRSGCVLVLAVACGFGALSFQPVAAADNKRKPTPTTRPTTQPKAKPKPKPNAKVVTTRPDTASLPKWLAEMIVKADIVSVYSYSVGSESFYTLVPSCCDRFTTAHTSDGAYVCAPSGGFVGSGSNDCPEEHKNPKNQKLVWQKPNK
jgi:hypothetical protein